ncbi:DUF4097 family beta strand repeat-containing protein [Streptomyces sp. NPDC047070]|uniref:DUF4097 family beta strand repeat-containing protein n=1 Tax=Streptomyces sp. NPDC047070 TaxID=3154923 RepID=UPI0034526B39
MPAFATPSPLSVNLWLPRGVVRITAGTRAETVVEVKPTDQNSERDRKAVERTHVDCSGTELVIEGPRKRSFLDGSGSVDISVELPAGSRLSGKSDMGALHCVGELAGCEFTTDFGEIQLDRTGEVRLQSGSGDIEVGSVSGGADIRAGSGDIRLGSVDGELTLKNSNGAMHVKEVTGPVKATAGNGDFIVGLAHTTVTVRSNNGHIRVNEALGGRLELKTSAGEIEVGVREGATAWLDLQTKSKVGTVHNSLGPAESFVREDADLEIHAVTSSGDVVVRGADQA